MNVKIKITLCAVLCASLLAGCADNSAGVSSAVSADSSSGRSSAVKESVAKAAGADKSFYFMHSACTLCSFVRRGKERKDWGKERKD